MDVPLDGRDPAGVVDGDLVQLTAGVGAGPSVLGVGLLADRHPVEREGGGGEDEENGEEPHT